MGYKMEVEVDGVPLRIGGIAKGSGMIPPGHTRIILHTQIYLLVADNHCVIYSVCRYVLVNV